MLLDEIGNFLQTNGIGTVNTNIFLSEMPDQPDSCVALYEYQGFPPGFVFGKTIPIYEEPKFQVVVRDVSYAAARLKANNIYKLLVGMGDQVLSGTRYLGIQALESPFADPGGRDAANRAKVLCNYEAQKEVSTS